MKKVTKKSEELGLCLGIRSLRVGNETSVQKHCAGLCIYSLGLKTHLFTYFLVRILLQII